LTARPRLPRSITYGPNFTFTPAVSIVVYCKTQKELDRFWERLSDGGAQVECGWLTDKYGLSWQIVPGVLPRMAADKDARKVDRVMRAVLQMKKLDIAALKRVYAGK
jgi:predicted 3-demethylubiquinone-9 3-methyltransferase (glyoxalase superfamily)